MQTLIRSHGAISKANRFTSGRFLRCLFAVVAVSSLISCRPHEKPPIITHYDSAPVSRLLVDSDVGTSHAMDITQYRAFFGMIGYSDWTKFKLNDSITYETLLSDLKDEISSADSVVSETLSLASKPDDLPSELASLWMRDAMGSVLKVSYSKNGNIDWLIYPQSRIVWSHSYD